MSRTYRYSERSHDVRKKRRAARHDEGPFRCGRCKAMVGPVPSGGKHRNHCPYCLYSKHVDGRVPGDRASACGGSMAPVAAFVRPNGEHAIVHRCLRCGFERYNRIAADDYFDLVLSLPLVEERSSRAIEPPDQQDLSA